MVCETSCSYHCYVRSFGRGLRQEALEAVTATHQLVAAVHTLGLCTRPLLLAGFPAAAAEAGAPPLVAEELGAQPPEQARAGARGRAPGRACMRRRDSRSGDAREAYALPPGLLACCSAAHACTAPLKHARSPGGSALFVSHA